MFGFWGEHLYGERCAVGGVQLWAPKTTNLMTLHLTPKGGKANAVYSASPARVDQKHQLFLFQKCRGGRACRRRLRAVDGLPLPHCPFLHTQGYICDLSLVHPDRGDAATHGFGDHSQAAAAEDGRVLEVAHLELGGHALLDIRRSVVKRWLGHSEADIKSVGKQVSTLVNVPVFCHLVRRQKAVHTTEWWAAHQNTTFHSADELMAAAGHVANPPPIFGMVCCTIVSYCTPAWRRCVAGGERCLGNVADPNRRFYWTVFLNSHLRGGFALCFCTCRVVACHRRTRSLASQRRERLMRMSSRMELKGPRRSRGVSTTCLGSWR